MLNLTAIGCLAVFPELILKILVLSFTHFFEGFYPQFSGISSKEFFLFRKLIIRKSITSNFRENNNEKNNC
jgi:hypothetical protein